jgi:hypothetical protein
MSTQLGALVLFAALNGGTLESTVYDDYRQAWQSGRTRGLPLLVILNPGEVAGSPPVDIEWLRRSSHRRELLKNFVVVVIDASTPEGKKVHKQFGSAALPRVSVIDRQQKWQVYRTSQLLSAEDWNMVLEKHKKGDPPPPRPKPAQCLT